MHAHTHAALATTSRSVTWTCLFWAFHINGIIQHVVFCDWLLSLGILFSGFIHAVACISVSFLFKAEYYSIVSMGHILFIPSSAAGHLSRFCLLSVMTNAAMHICAQVLGVDACFHFSGVETEEEREFPGGPVVRSRHFPCRGPGFNPWSGN